MRRLVIALLCVCFPSAWAQQVVISGQVQIGGQVNIGGPTGPTIVIPQPVIVSPAALPSATQNAVYSYTLTGSNGTPPYTWTVSVGSLPTGMSLSSAGIISGTPTGTGTSTFTVLLTDSKSQTASQQFQLIVLTASSPLSIVQTSIPAGTVNSAYSQTLTATGGSGGGYSFTLASGTWPAGITLSSGGVISGTPTQSGSFTVTVQVTDSGANTAHQNYTLTINTVVVTGSADNRYCTSSGTWIGATTDGPAALPTSCFYTPVSATPSPGTVRTTTAANFNTTYAASSCGDTIKVTGGTSFTGTWNITKQCDNAHWITVEGSGVTSDVNFPAEGTRNSPCFSNVTSLPNRPSYPCGSPASDTAQVMAPASSSALKINGASYHRFIGMEFTRVTTAAVPVYFIVDLSNTATQTNHIIFDRVWIHGVNADGTFPQSRATDTSTTRGIYLGQSNHIALIDSYCSDFYDNGSVATNGNSDAQCIGGGFGGISNSGWGVYKFVNNHIEGSAEGILLGGAGGPPLTPTGCTVLVNCNLDVPTDIEVRRNLFFKPLSWNGNTTSSPVSVGWPVEKNGFEMKIGARALFEANVVQNVWYSAQVGECWALAPKNQSAGTSGSAPTALTNDFTFRYNYCYNAAQGPMYYVTMDANCTSCQTQGMNRISVHGTLADDALGLFNTTLVPFSCCTADELAMTTVPDFTGKGLNKIQNFSYQHNTHVRGGRYLFGFGAAGSNLIFNLTMQNNIWAIAQGVGSNPSLSGCSTTNTFTQILSSCVTTSTVDHNFVFGTASLTGWPSGNTAEATSTAMGFTSYGTGDSNMTPGNYALTAGSPGHNAASDGSDVGANITQLNSEISGVASY